MKDKNYIYVYLDPRKSGKYIYGEYKFDYEPFYVGKGQGNRWVHHIRNVKNGIKDVNPHKINKIKKILKEGYNLENFVIKIFENISNDNINELEDKIINIIGKLKDFKGPLLNIGNSNNSGQINIQRKEETKIKLSESKKGNKNPNFGKIPINKGKSLEEIYGEKKAKEIREKLRISHLGHFVSNETKIKLSKAHEKRTKYNLNGNGGKLWKFIKPNGEEIIIKGKFIIFCEENSLPFSILRSIAQNKRKNKFFKGWTVIKI